MSFPFSYWGSPCYSGGFSSGFFTGGYVVINAVGQSTPYPSIINVYGLKGDISKVTVNLTGLSHPYPEDISMMLMSPNGQKLVLMSDTLGDTNLNNISIIINDYQENYFPDVAGDIVIPELEVPYLLTGFLPINYNLGGGFVIAGFPNISGGMVDFNGYQANGEWKLFSLDTANGDSGSFYWNLEIETIHDCSYIGSLPTLTEGSGITISAEGVSPYPSNITISNFKGQISKLSLKLNGLSHDFTQDMDIMLESPFGKRILAMSDCLADTKLNHAFITITDDAITTFPTVNTPEMAIPFVITGYKPTDNDGGSAGNDNFPPPALTANITTMNGFTGFNPNGIWKLYAMDNVPLDGGYLDGWDLDIETTNTQENTSPFIPSIQSIYINDNTTGTPYPSILNISNTRGVIDDVGLVLYGLNHSNASNINMVLESPSKRRVGIMSHIGGSGSGVSVSRIIISSALSGFSTTFPIQDGRSYRPTLNNFTGMPLPCPLVSTSTPSFNTFRGYSPNGDWKLWISDDNIGSNGILSGWGVYGRLTNRLENL